MLIHLLDLADHLFLVTLVYKELMGTPHFSSLERPDMSLS